ncbi:relaxase/mobilization nuclease domain-containing protein [bacterium SCSIO 12827]|nr:relaxase/mobilization nuclease domain-containing protein [bacterium SCSIO 12827]
MIAKKIPKQSGIADNFERLGRYIAAADHPGEKLRNCWFGNCNAGAGLEDLEVALIEIEATRMMRPEATDRTYHLVVSFRSGEESKLSDDALRKIAGGYVEALGFEGHQYVAGAHENTDNFHMHIAINRVHPGTNKIIAPFNDFKTLERISRGFEKEFGLSVDRGMSDRESGRNPLSPEARDYERHTWQQSFQRFMLDRKPEVLAAVEQARGWNHLHSQLAVWNVGVKPRGNGLVFYDLDGQGTMKASAMGRQCSKNALEERLGPFQAPANRIERGVGIAKARYHRPPLLSRHPNIGPLWSRYIGQQSHELTRKGLISRVASNWKMWLAMEAYEDPLAMVLVVAHTEALRAVFGEPPSPRLFPKIAAPALEEVTKSRKWTDVPKRRLTAAGCESEMLDVGAGRSVALVKNDQADLVGLVVIDDKGKACALGPKETLKMWVKGKGSGKDKSLGRGIG